MKVTDVRDAWPAYFCAAANLLAIAAMATILAPGTTLFPEEARFVYIRENAWLWRIGWSLWVAAAVSLIVFYLWWRRRIGSGELPLWIAVAAFATDMVAEATLIILVPWRPEFSREAFLLTGGLANGLYTLAGMALTRATPNVSGGFAVWTWVMWAVGIALSVVTFLELALAIAATSAVLFVLFIPWCIAMGRRLA